MSQRQRENGPPAEYREGFNGESAVPLQLPGYLPPQSLEMEQACLGAALISTTAATELLAELDREDFYNEAHRNLYDGIAWHVLRDQSCDSLAVGEWLRDRDLLGKIGGMSYVLALCDQVPTAAHFLQYAGVVKDKSLRRRIREATVKIAWEADQNEDAAEVICDRAEESLLAVRGRRKELEAISPATAQVDQVRRYFNPGGERPGLVSGWEQLDNITKAKRGQFIVVAGRPGMGKTSICTAYMVNQARYGVAAALFSLEMSREEIEDRIVAAEAGVSLTRMQEGQLSPEERMQVLNAMQRLSELPYVIIDGSQTDMTVPLLRSEIRRRQRDLKPQVVVVDQLSYLDPNGKYENENIRFKRIAYALKQTAQACQVALMVPHQFSREVTRREGKRPVLSDLRDSGGVEDSCDQAWLLHSAAYYEEQKGERSEHQIDRVEVIIAKNRGGKKGVAHLGFRQSSQQWGDAKGFDLEETARPERSRYPDDD